MLEYIGLKLFFYDIRKLHARMGEKFHPIVLKWFMRCRDDHTGLKIILAHEAGHARSGNHTGECGRGAGLNQTGSEKTGNVRAGLARVHADQDMSFAVLAIQIGAQRAAGSKERGVVQRRRTRDAANTIGSEEFFGHGEEPAYLPCALRAADFPWTTPKKLNTRELRNFPVQRQRCPLQQRKRGKSPTDPSVSGLETKTHDAFDSL